MRTHFMINLFSNVDTDIYENSLNFFTNQLEKEFYVKDEDNLHIGLARLVLPKLTNPQHDEVVMKSYDAILFDKYEGSSKEIHAARDEFVLRPMAKACTPVVIIRPMLSDEEDSQESNDGEMQNDYSDAVTMQEKYNRDSNKWICSFTTSANENKNLWTISGFIKLILSKVISAEPFTKKYFSHFLNPEVIFDYKTVEFLGEGIAVDEKDFITFTFNLEELVDIKSGETMQTFFPFFALDDFEKQKKYFQSMDFNMSLKLPYTLKDVLRELLYAIMSHIERFYEIEAEVSEGKGVRLRDFFDMLWDERKVLDKQLARTMSYSEVMRKYRYVSVRKRDFCRRFVDKFINAVLDERVVLLKEYNLSPKSDENHFIFVTSNIVKATQCGNQTYQLLATFPIITTTAAHTVSYEPQNIMYNPISLSSFKEISIMVTYENGQKITCMPSYSPTSCLLSIVSF